MLQKKGIVKLPESLDALLEQYGSSHLPSRQWPSDHLIVGAVFSFVIPWLRIGSSAASFKIISWNVLGDHCLGHHPYVKYNSEERRELQRKILNDYVAQGVDFIWRGLYLSSRSGYWNHCPTSLVRKIFGIEHALAIGILHLLQD